ncbi:hypothetical protein CDCA_CDCA19G4744 [Cyanidium caldarium]|uniref:Cyclin-like domain-containing protein n=1 Tax=Cyanidium caldarium TaxID=2771 RepID=A0AAV9J2D8_CYACA|nr:hypothetical protein CDCA_CDCA19G4744 [Cyanidium caldarium]
MTGRTRQYPKRPGEEPEAGELRSTGPSRRRRTAEDGKAWAAADNLTKSASLVEKVVDGGAGIDEACARVSAGPRATRRRVVRRSEAAAVLPTTAADAPAEDAAVSTATPKPDLGRPPLHTVAEAPASATAITAMLCVHCGSQVVDVSPAGGHTTCVLCGHVLEESAVVNEVQFTEGRGGHVNAAGRFVPTGFTVPSATGALMAPAGASGALRFPFTHRDSREMTIAAGRRRIATLASQLHLPERFVDAAQRIFALAVQHNFIQGRRTQTVAAAALYIICRRERTSHMLIDFCDVLRINMYALGHIFLKLCRVLHLSLPATDPSFYIHRFAARLQLGAQQEAVSQTALRLIGAMKRDWLSTGRRPAGLCGAALLIAARRHGIRLSQREVGTVVRVGDMTIRQRVLEIEGQPQEDGQEGEGAAAAAVLSAQDRALLEAQLEEEEEEEEEETAPEDASAWWGIPGAAADDGAMIGRTTRRTTVHFVGDSSSSSSSSSASSSASDADRPDRARDTPPQVAATATSSTDRLELLSDLDSEEERAFVCSPEETRARERIWMAMNREWLEREAEIARWQVEEPLRYQKLMRKREYMRIVSGRASGNGGGSAANATPAETTLPGTDVGGGETVRSVREAVQHAVSHSKRTSRKINYAALQRFDQRGQEQGSGNAESGPGDDGAEAPASLFDFGDAPPATDAAPPGRGTTTRRKRGRPRRGAATRAR